LAISQISIIKLAIIVNQFFFERNTKDAKNSAGTGKTSVDYRIMRHY
jgi:hypothetical protein